MRNKWTSRKFWVTILAAIYAVAAMQGWKIPIEEVVLVDAVVMLWVLLEWVIDLVKKGEGVPVPIPIPPIPITPVPVPDIEKPEINTYIIGAKTVAEDLKRLGIKPLQADKLWRAQMLDRQYKFTDMEGWGKAIEYIYTAYEWPDWEVEEFDCDDFSKLFEALLSKDFGLNGQCRVFGTIPHPQTGEPAPHGFNIVAERDGWHLFEPNPNFPWAWAPFEIGENGYIPKEYLM